MRHKILAMQKLILLLLLPVMMGAQSFEKKQVDLNLGLGLGNTFAASGHYRAMPPISAAIEYGVTDDISIGGYLAFATAAWRYTGRDWCNNGNNSGYYDYTDEYRWTYYIVGVRGAYHFGRFIKEDKLDLYAGLLLGNNFAHYNFSSNDPCSNHHSDTYAQSYGGFIFGGFVGARYRFTEKVGAFAEFGYGIAYLTIGVNFKLN